MFPRVREITDAFGGCLRISAEVHPSGALVHIERPDRERYAAAVLDGYGAEVLAGYIMAARLALPNPLPDEIVDGSFPLRFSLRQAEQVSLILTQGSADRDFQIPSPFWDRLYAELSLVNAHTRELGRRRTCRLQ
ncbi:MAG: hypothetical protein ACKVOP_04915 [Sphingomonadaceae bacterium]